MIRFTAVLEEEGKAARALAFESSADSITLGRDSKCDFQIPVPAISRQHCRIYFQDDTYIIQDLRSTYGTLINGKKLESDEKKVLSSGDIIELASVRITVSIELEESAQEVSAVGEKTQALAAKAVEEILSGINQGSAHDEGPYLRVLNGFDEGTRFVFGNSNEWYMGRSKDCDFIINDPNISRRHAIIRKDWEGYYVEDLGSKNGVLVNDKKVVKRRFLRHRDEILIGPVKLLFVDPNYELFNAIDQIEGFENNNKYEDEAPKEEEEVSASGVADIEPPPDGGNEASGAEGGGDAPSAPAEGAESQPAGEGNPAAEEDELPDDIDADLLEPVEEKSSFGIIALIVGGIVLVIGIILLVLLFL